MAKGSLPGTHASALGTDVSKSRAKPQWKTTKAGRKQMENTMEGKRGLLPLRSNLFALHHLHHTLSLRLQKQLQPNLPAGFRKYGKHSHAMCYHCKVVECKCFARASHAVMSSLPKLWAWRPWGVATAKTVCGTVCSICLAYVCFCGCFLGTADLARVGCGGVTSVPGGFSFKKNLAFLDGSSFT